MNSEEDEFKRIEAEALRRAAKDGPDEFTAVYEINGVNLANGDPEQEGVFGSKELLANAKACASGDSFIAEMRRDFGGRIVG